MVHILHSYSCGNYLINESYLGAINIISELFGSLADRDETSNEIPSDCVWEHIYCFNEDKFESMKEPSMSRNISSLSVTGSLPYPSFLTALQPAKISRHYISNGGHNNS